MPVSHFWQRLHHLQVPRIINVSRRLSVNYRTRQENKSDIYFLRLFLSSFHMVTVVYDLTFHLSLQYLYSWETLSKNFSLRLGRRFSLREAIIASSLYYIWKKERTIRAARYIFFFFGGSGVLGR